MARKTKEEWFHSGFQTLIREGAGRLIIDSLTRKLGITKGSFYHHFKSRSDYVNQLLHFWEKKMTLDLINLADAEQDARGKIKRLTDLCIQAQNGGLEVAIRAWALRDPVVREFQQRVDEARLDYLCGVVSELSGDAGRAEHIAKIIMAVYIGTQQMLPPIQGNEVRPLYQTLELLTEKLSAKETDD